MISQADSTKLKDEFFTELEKKYFMIPRNAWWAAVGGAIAMLAAVGLVSYKSALVGATNPVVAAAVETAKQSILKSEATAKAGVEAILKDVAIRKKIEADAVVAHNAAQKAAQDAYNKSHRDPPDGSGRK